MKSQDSFGAFEADTSVADFDAALRRLKGIRPLLLDLIRFFEEDAPLLVDEIERAARRRDPETVRHASHSLKGLASNFDGYRVMTIAKEFELLAADGRSEAVATEVDGLREEVGRLLNSMQRYRKRIE